MRKYIITLFFIIVLLAIDSTVWAAQNLVRSVYDNQGSYLSTPHKVYTTNGWVYQFQSDGQTDYPNEIYLPNEKRPENYRIHSNYGKNTDSCASCHATHTAVGNSLLQWYDEYQTCMACHDGTVSTTYNVVEGTMPSGQLTPGGAFGTGDEENSSYHNVTGGVLIGSAPGNNLAMGSHNDQPLGCQSCHSPHGLGGNARILNPDPNGVQTKKAKFNYKLIQIGVNEILPGSVDRVIYAAYPVNVDGSFNTNLEPYYMLKGYPYNVKVYNDGNEVSQNNFYIDNSQGFSKIGIFPDQLTGPVSADFVPSIRVTMDIKNYLGQGGVETSHYNQGITQFCSSCHDDYNYHMGVSTGVYRHPVDISLSETALAIDTSNPIYISQIQNKMEPNSKIVCLTCHVAHGVSSDYWQKSLGYTSDESRELAGDTALKISPNSSMCLVCHENDVANEGYNANTYQPHNDQISATADSIFTQSLGISGYIGQNATSCGGEYCHKFIADNWKTTLHSNGFTDNKGIISEAQTGLQKYTGLTIQNVVYVIGNKRAQRYVWQDNNGIYKVAPSEYLITTKTWDPSKEPAESFIESCSGCHVTGLNRAQKTWADNGVSCEACHGGGNNHRIKPSSRNITNPRYLSIADQSDVCAQCHALGLSPDGHNYPIGYMPYAEGLRSSVTRGVYSLSAYFSVYTPYSINEFSSSSQTKGNFYSQKNMSSSTKDSVYPAQEFNDFVQSKHYQSGTMSCSTCHSSHQQNSDGKMLKVTFDQTCGTCHGATFNIDEIMPKRIGITKNPMDNLRVHTFAPRHESSDELSGSAVLIH